MGLFDKVKNLFTEEVEEEVRPVRKETRYVEPVVQPKEEPVVIPTKPVREEIKPDPVPTKEEKFVFFSDDDFKDLEKPKVEQPKKVEKKEEKPLAYKGAIPQTKPEPKKEFKPSPIISPVYGVLDKNYKKEEIVSKKVPSRIYRNSTVTVDDVRNKAYGTLEDDLKDDLLGRAFIEEKEEPIETDINIFEELEKYELEEPEEITSRSTSNVDEIFGKLDNKKDEILDELDNKKEEILDEIDTKKTSLNLLSDDYEIDEEKEFKEETSDEYLTKSFLEEDDIESEVENDNFNVSNDEAEDLALKLEEQKKKLQEINDLMDENEKVTKNKDKKSKKEEVEEDDLDESELFNLIDSMYEKKDDE